MVCTKEFFNGILKKNYIYMHIFAIPYVFIYFKGFVMIKFHLTVLSYDLRGLGVCSQLSIWLSGQKRQATSSVKWSV